VKDSSDVLVNVLQGSNGEFVTQYQTLVAGISRMNSFIVDKGGIYATYYSEG
jgi:hypothetical protein